MNSAAGHENTIVVKVQRPLSPPTAPWLVKSKCGSIVDHIEPSKAERKAVGYDATAYFRATVDQDEKVHLVKRINGQSW